MERLLVLFNAVTALLGFHQQPSYLTPPLSPSKVFPGKYVADIKECLVLARRPIPANARDIRPDDVTVIMALGDSVSAAFYAQSTSWAELIEWRGLSYATGMDDGAVTLATLMSHYTADLAGGSYGDQVATLCPLGDDMCTPQFESEVAGLNAAISGAHASNLPHETEYLLKEYNATEKRDGWTFLNVMIGANDQCQYGCGSYLGDPKLYAKGVFAAVEEVRAVVPRLIVNVIGNLKVSEVYAKTINARWCSQPPFRFPHLSVECGCAFTPGPVGELTRESMDRLAEEYDAELKTLINAWNAENDPRFAVAFQPGKVFSVKHGPIEALSRVDCFHPSVVGHRHLAAGIWNRLAFDTTRKGVVTSPDDAAVRVRCLEESDRIQIPSSL